MRPLRPCGPGAKYPSCPPLGGPVGTNQARRGSSNICDRFVAPKAQWTWGSGGDAPGNIFGATPFYSMGNALFLGERPS